MSGTRLSFAAGAHRYYLRDHAGKKRPIPAVSTLLGQADKGEGLKRWGPRVAAEYAVDHWDDLAAMPPAQRRKAIADSPWTSMSTAAATGTAIHAMAEQLLAGTPVDVPAAVQAQVEGLARWWERAWLVRVAAEQQVWSDDDDEFQLSGYAGTLDLRVDHPQRGPGIVDIKTGSGVWPETAIQLQAYASAEWCVVDGVDVRPGAVAWLAALHVRPEGTRLHLVPPEARRNAAARWEQLRAWRATEQPWLEEQVGVGA